MRNISNIYICPQAHQATKHNPLIIIITIPSWTTAKNFYRNSSYTAIT